MTAQAICLREALGEIRVLLIRTSSMRRYTFPKGHRWPEETPEGAAARELYEESGYKAVPLRIVEADAENVFIAFGNAYRIAEGEPKRQPMWLSISKARVALMQNRTPPEFTPMLNALDRAVYYFCADPSLEQERLGSSPRPL
jgi:8-oxo-dGTP pyrophosphatase MutT (NUDIX family)